MTSIARQRAEGHDTTAFIIHSQHLHELNTENRARKQMKEGNSHSHTSAAARRSGTPPHIALAYKTLISSQTREDDGFPFTVTESYYGTQRAKHHQASLFLWAVRENENQPVHMKSHWLLQRLLSVNVSFGFSVLFGPVCFRLQYGSFCTLEFPWLFPPFLY